MSPPRQALTRVAEDYLKAIWSAEEWGGDPTTVRQLADRFDVSPATVSVTLKRLAAQGLLEHQAYGPIVLTDEGRRHALAVVRRHRLLETFLVQVLDYDWAEVHEEAEELEHAASDRLIDRIATALGDPAADPHGDPIPTADGRTRRPADVLTLRDAPAGLYRITRISDEQPEVLQRFAARGMLPGRVFELVDRRADALVLSLPDEIVEMTPDDAHAALLEKTVEL